MSASRRPGPPSNTGLSASHFSGTMSMRPLRVTMIRDVDEGGSLSKSRRRAHLKGINQSFKGLQNVGWLRLVWTNLEFSKQPHVCL
jgi:hypothetical protein